LEKMFAGVWFEARRWTAPNAFEVDFRHGGATEKKKRPQMDTDLHRSSESVFHLC
jgi:hypothetical protein